MRDQRNSGRINLANSEGKSKLARFAKTEKHAAPDKSMRHSALPSFWPKPRYQSEVKQNAKLNLDAVTDVIPIIPRSCGELQFELIPNAAVNAVDRGRHLYSTKYAQDPASTIECRGAVVRSTKLTRIDVVPRQNCTIE